MGKNVKLFLGALAFTLCFLGITVIQSCTQKRSMPVSSDLPDSLTQKDREYFRELLMIDPEKEFEVEYKRVSNLEVQLLERYKYDGVKFVLAIQDETAFYPLGKFPANCPWFALNGFTPTKFIDSNFQSLSKDLPVMIRAMKERCRYIYAERTGGDWQLHYVLITLPYKGVRYPVVYRGGAPNPQPVESMLPYRWALPPMLKKLYAVHDGFGDITGTAVLNSKELVSLTEYDNHQKPNLGPGISPGDVLVAIDYGSDWVDCFIREKGSKTSNMMAEWDKDVLEVTRKEMNFFELLEELFGDPDEQ